MKTNHRTPLFLISATLIALLSGCTFSLFSTTSKDNPTRHFVLSSQTQNIREETSIPQLVFAKISIPSYLDYPQIVTRDGNEVYRSEKNRWGEPLPRAVARELPLLCAMILANAQIDPSGKELFVAIDRLDGTLNGSVEISATYEFRPQKQTNIDPVGKSQRFKMSIPVEQPNDYNAYVFAMNTALKALAQDIATQFSK